MTNQDTLIKQGFELKHQDNSRTHYVKDLDGFTLLHIFLKPDGSFSGELQRLLLLQKEQIQTTKNVFYVG